MQLRDLFNVPRKRIQTSSDFVKRTAQYIEQVYKDETPLQRTKRLINMGEHNG